jgi:hypothetical protein
MTLLSEPALNDVLFTQGQYQELCDEFNDYKNKLYNFPDPQARIFIDRERLLRLCETAEKKFREDDANTIIVTSTHLNTAITFRKIKVTITAFNQLLNALTTMHENLQNLEMFASKIEYQCVALELQRKYNKLARECYKNALELAEAAISHPQIGKEDVDKGATITEINLLTTVVDQANNLYLDPNNITKQQNFAKTLADIPKKEYKFSMNWKPLIASLLIISGFVMMAFALPPLIYLFADKLILPAFFILATGGALAATAGIGLTRRANSNPTFSFRSPYQFFHNKTPPAFVPDFVKFMEASQQLIPKFLKVQESLRGSLDNLNTLETQQRQQYQPGYSY